MNEATKKNIVVEYAVRQREFIGLKNIFDKMKQRHDTFKALPAGKTLGKRTSLEVQFPQYLEGELFTVNQLVNATKLGHEQAKELCSRLQFVALLKQVQVAGPNGTKSFYTFESSDLQQRIDVIEARLKIDTWSEDKEVVAKMHEQWRFLIELLKEEMKNE